MRSCSRSPPDGADRLASRAMPPLRSRAPLSPPGRRGARAGRAGARRAASASTTGRSPTSRCRGSRRAGWTSARPRSRAATSAGPGSRSRTLQDTALDRCTLAGVVSQDGGLRRVRFTDCRLTGMAWPECDLEDVDLRGLPLRPRRASASPASSASPSRTACCARPTSRARRSARSASRAANCASGDVRRRPVRGDRAAAAASWTASKASDGLHGAALPGPTWSASPAHGGALGIRVLDEEASGGAQAAPQRAAQEAIPSHPCGLPAQHQPSLRRPAAEPDRGDAAVAAAGAGELHAVVAGDRSGWWVTSAMPSSSVSGERLLGRRAAPSRRRG